MDAPVNLDDPKFKLPTEFITIDTAPKKEDMPCPGHTVPMDSAKCQWCGIVITDKAELRAARRRRGERRQWAQESIKKAYTPKADPVPFLDDAKIPEFSLDGFAIVCPGCGLTEHWADAKTIEYKGAVGAEVRCGCGTISRGPDQELPEEHQANSCRHLAGKNIFGLTAMEIEEVLRDYAKWHTAVGSVILSIAARMQAKNPMGGKLFLRTLREVMAKPATAAP